MRSVRRRGRRRHPDAHRREHRRGADGRHAGRRRVHRHGRRRQHRQPPAALARPGQVCVGPATHAATLGVIELRAARPGPGAGQGRAGARPGGPSTCCSCPATGPDAADRPGRARRRARPCCAVRVATASSTSAGRSSCCCSARRAWARPAWPTSWPSWLQRRAGRPHARGPVRPLRRGQHLVADRRRRVRACATSRRRDPRRCPERVREGRGATFKAGPTTPRCSVTRAACST